MAMETYNFSVKSIEFAVMRRAQSGWKFETNFNRDNYILAFAENGFANYVIDGKDYLIEKGAMMFFKKGLMHSAVSDTNNPWSFFSIAFDLTCFSPDTQKALEKLNPVIYVEHYEKCRELFFELYNLWSKKSDAYMLKCRSILEDLLYYYITTQINENNFILHKDALEMVKEYILINYKEHYSVEFLANMVNLSPSYFRTLFKRYTGQTIIQYQNSVKIEKACALLRSGLCNVTEAAEATGFSDIYYFSRLFKKIKGKTPIKYIH